MEMLNLISGDNLFKYSFTLGIVMVVFSLVYPLQKQNEIDLEIINHNKEVSLINNQIDNLLKTTKSLEIESNDLLNKVTKLKNYKSKKASLKKEVENFTVKFDKVEDIKREIDTKKIIVDFNLSKIKVLETQSNVFASYTKWIFTFGVLFSIFGFVFWTWKTFKDWRNPS